MSDYRELLIGCGSRREKDIARFLAMHPGYLKLRPEMKVLMHEWCDITTLDNREDCKPDILFDLSTIGKTEELFAEELFNEIHAYEVLEHIGVQGDYETFFAQFTEFHRILKPGGLFCATCPSWQSMWAWGDPSHTRVITSGTLAFLSQAEYEKQVGRTAMSDFRHLYKADFEPVFVFEDQDALAFVLKAIK